MKLKEILKPENVIEEMKSTNRDQALRELLGPVAEDIPAPTEKLVKILIDRENQSPTAISGGVAVPHGRIPELENFLMVVGKSRSGVPFGAEDGHTRIFFLLMAPTNNTATHLKILARIARLCRNPGFRENILSAASRKDIYQTIMKGDALI